jgi:hypothetical protein
MTAPFFTLKCMRLLPGSAAQVMLLCFVVAYIFAIIGYEPFLPCIALIGAFSMKLLSDIPECTPCEEINEHLNYGSFGKALLAVFVVLTAEGWANQMSYAMTSNRLYSLFYVALIVRVRSFPSQALSIVRCLLF